MNSSFFENNKSMTICIIVACVLFVFVIFIEDDYHEYIHHKHDNRFQVSSSMSIAMSNENIPILCRNDHDHYGNKINSECKTSKIFTDAAVFLVRPRQTIVDVNSNYGYTAILLAKQTGLMCKIKAFENDLDVFLMLQKNIILNDMENIITSKHCVFSNDCGHIIIPKRYEKHKNIKMECISIDKIFPELKIDLLLLNSSTSSNLRILEGAFKLLLQNNLCNTLINLDVDYETKHCNVQEILTNLQFNGFKFYCTHDGKKFHKILINEIMEERKVVILVTTANL